MRKKSVLLRGWSVSAVLLYSMMLVVLLSVQALAGAPGKLSLVSMGTGDPDNMTIRAQKTIDAADIFFTMGARSDRYGDLVRGRPVYDAEHGLFGEGGARPRKSPEDAEKLRVENRKIIREAVAAGKNVVILDNGDPTIFGPHIGYMKEFADLDPEIIPGISSFNAANAALKMSVVSGNARAVTLTSAQLDGDRDKLLALLIQEGFTMSFFMVRDLEAFLSTMKAHLAETTPVAIVSNAGSKEQEQVIKGTLGTIHTLIKPEALGAYLLYIGNSL